MRKITLILFLIFQVMLSSAECSEFGMSFFPEQKNISLNSMFIIEGYALSQQTVESFKNRTVYLESEDGDIVELCLQEMLKGQMELTQAVFKPANSLKPNTKYSLKYSEQTERETKEMRRSNPETGKQERVYWQTSELNTMDLPPANLTITYGRNEAIVYGCGPSINAVFHITNTGNAKIWYKTEVVDISTNQKTVFYLTDWEDTLYVGHGMCSGAFTFKNEGNYKVRFMPENTDGKSVKTTGWNTFENPNNAFGY